MNKKLQKELILAIKKINEDKGIKYNEILPDISKIFIELGYTTQEIMTNMQLLNETGLITGYEKEYYPTIYLTATGHQSLMPWYNKFFDIRSISKLGNLILLTINILLGILNIIFFNK